MRPDGDGSSGILLISEALGEKEAETGLPFQGGAGYLLNRVLERAGIPRPALTIINVIWCRPPDNELVGMPYRERATAQCLPAHSWPVIKARKPKVIVTLGKVPTEALLGPVGDLEAVRGFPVWHHEAQAWVIPTYHPSFIQRGKFNLEAVLIYDLQRAEEIAKAAETDGVQQAYKPRWGKYVLDPPVSVAAAWVKRTLTEKSEYPLSFDGEWDRRSERMTRLGFSRGPYTGISMPWRPEFFGVFRTLLESDIEKLAWNKIADITALAKAGFEVRGQVIDGMVAWHILNTDLPKALDYVATFAAPDQPRWAHLAHTQPALYNAVDCDVTLRIYLRVKEELEAVGRWGVFVDHVLRLDRRLEKMSAAGMPIDPTRRMEAAKQVEEGLVEAQKVIAEAIPDEIRPVTPKLGYKRVPKDITGLVIRTFIDPKDGKVERYAKLAPLKISPKLILAYQRFKEHRIQYKKVKGRKKAPTTDKHALKHLVLLYPEDPLYVRLMDERKLKQLRGSFLGKVTNGVIKGGLKIGADNRAHPHFNHNPSTLRTATDNPTLQNLPRPTDAWARLVKGIFVAPKGWRFEARDYKGIEGVLVGYFAKSRTLTRLALIDIHTYVTAWWMHEQGQVRFNDLPQPSMTDAQLMPILENFKARFKPERQGIKVQVHAVNYMARARKVQEILFDELGWTLPLKEIRSFMGFYRELFPEVFRFHRALLSEVEGITYNGLHGLRTGVNWIQNPYDYLHRFHQIVTWKEIGGEWDWVPGAGANELAAFPAQSTAAGIAKDAILLMEEKYPELVEGLRLFIHDELLGEWREDQQEAAQAALKDVMETPIKRLPLPPEWEMGEYLRIYTEGKTGPVWGEMKERL